MKSKLAFFFENDQNLEHVQKFHSNKGVSELSKIPIVFRKENRADYFLKILSMTMFMALHGLTHRIRFKSLQSGVSSKRNIVVFRILF